MNIKQSGGKLGTISFSNALIFLNLLPGTVTSACRDIGTEKVRDPSAEGSGYSFFIYQSKEDISGDTITGFPMAVD